MEKKQYIQPTLALYKVEISALMEASKDTPDYKPNESFEDEGAVGTRRFSVWDEEEEEE